MAWQKKSVARCAECGQPIRWATTTNDAPIPLMPSSDPEGVYLFTGPGVVRHLPSWERERHRVALAAGETQRQLFLPHVAECTARKDPEPVPEDTLARLQRIIDAPKAKGARRA